MYRIARERCRADRPPISSASWSRGPELSETRKRSKIGPRGACGASLARPAKARPTENAAMNIRRDQRSGIAGLRKKDRYTPGSDSRLK